MTEEAFLRYRMAVVERMPNSPYETALIVAIQHRMEALRMEALRVQFRPNGTAGS